MATTRAASPRFRAEDPSPPVQLQEDDLEILWHVYCNRVIDSKSIYQLFGHRSEQGLSRRLNLLRRGRQPFLHRLRRVKPQPELRAGSEAMAYAIANQGALALREQRQVDVATARWTEKNVRLKPSTIQHELSASRFVARLRADATRRDDGTGVLYQQECRDIATLAKAGRGLPNRLRTRIDGWRGYRGTEATAPDRIIAISREGRRQYLFLEIDEGTETVAPRDEILGKPRFWRQTSVLRKLVIYAYAFETKAHRERFGIPVFRVLTVTTSPERVATMQAAWQQHLGTRPGLFLFTDWQQLDAHAGDVFELPLASAAGKPTLLLD